MASFQSCASIPALYAYAFRRASALLRADDIATLARTDGSDLSGLRWLDPKVLESAGSMIDGWADRGIRERYVLRVEQRDALLECFGPDLPHNGRCLTIMLNMLGDKFREFREDYGDAGVRRVAERAYVLPAPEAFLGEATNAPPPLGQMTSLAVVRRWSGAFLFVGPLSHAVALGDVPALERAELPERTRLSLTRAVEERALRVAVVVWRRHADADLVLADDAREGTFAVGSLRGNPLPAAFKRVVDMLAGKAVHIALFPELMMDDDSLSMLRAALVDSGKRFPALSVIGRTHRRASAGDRFVNTALVLDAFGKAVMEHEKLEPFTDDKLGPEDILPRESPAYRFLDTPAGRLVVNICRDLRSDVPMLLNRVLGATLILVPAYSRRLDFVKDEARVLGARQRSIVAAVNPCLVSRRQLHDAAYLYAPIRGLEESSFSIPGADIVQETSDGCAYVQIIEFRLGANRVAEMKAIWKEAV